MEEEKKVVISFEVDNVGAKNNVVELNKKLEENKKALSALQKEGKGSAEAYSKVAEEIVNLDLDTKNLNKEKAKEVKATQTVTGSLNAQRAELVRLKGTRDDINLGSIEGRKKFDELNRSILNLNNTVKKAEESGGDYQRSVGNYGKAMDAVRGTAKGLSAGFSGLNGVMSANPVGLLLLAFTTLKGAFAGTEEGAGKLRAVMAGLNSVVANFVDLIGTSAEMVVKFFSLDFEAAGKSFDELADGAKNFASEVRKDVNSAIELEEQLNVILKAERALNVERAQATQKINELNLIAEDTSGKFTNAERVAKLKEAIDLETGLTERRVSNEVKRLEILKAQAEINKSDEATLDAIAEQEIKVADLQSASFAQRKGLNAKLFGLLNQTKAVELKNTAEANAARKKASEEEIKRKEAEKKRADALRAQEEKDFLTAEQKKVTAELNLDAFRVQQKAEIANQEIEDERVRLQKSLENERLTDEQRRELRQQSSFNQMLILGEQAEREVQIQKDKLAQLLLNESLIDEERALLTEQSDANITSITQKFSSKQAEISIAEKNLVDKNETQKKNLKIQALNQGFEIAKQIAAENAELGLAIGVAEIGGNLFKEIAGIAASNSSTGPAAPFLIAALQGLAVARAALNLRGLIKNFAALKSKVGGGGGGGGASAPQVPRSSSTGIANLTKNTNQENRQNEAFQNAVENLPTPVVEVSELNRVQNRVKVSEENGRL